jgi:hypothetical protein|nr:MAG TPA: Putative amidoligase enzyme [Caudoviricetes sp.]
MEKLYVIDGKLMELEALATQMSSGEDFYFLRDTADSTNIKRIPVADLPKPYHEENVTLPPNVIYFANGIVKMTIDETVVDVGFGNKHIYKTKTGDFVETEKFYNVDGAIIYIDSEGGVVKIPNSPNEFNKESTSLWTELTVPVSVLTGRVVDGNIKVKVGVDLMPLNKEEVACSSLSDDIVIKNSENYVTTEDGDIITRQDVANGLTDEYFICADCGCIHHDSDTEYLDNYDKNVCSSCLENYHWSSYDNNYYSRGDCVYVGSIEDYVSYRSLNAYFRQCAHCGEYYLEDNTNVTENDYVICDRCYDDDDIVDEDNYYLHGETEFIRSYSYKPDAKFFGEGTNKYLGLEYEVQGGGCSDHTARKIFGKYPHWYCKYDGSLEDGFEAVTHPCTTQFMLNNIDWENLVETLDNAGYNEPEGAGIHIHVSRDHFESRSHIGKLVRFFAENYDKLVRFAKRNSSDAHQWARPTDVECCSTFESCYSEARCERYSAVNVQNSATIEIRLWNSTYEADVIRSFIQMTDVLTDLANGQWEDFTFANVRKLAEERQYKELLTRMDNLNM